MNKKINITVTALFLALIFGFGSAFWIIPDADFSPEENRPLQTFPTVNAESWLDGQVSSRLITYYSDQFPLRNAWVGLHALGELGVGRGESNGAASTPISPALSDWRTPIATAPPTWIGGSRRW